MSIKLAQVRDSLAEEVRAKRGPGRPRMSVAQVEASISEVEEALRTDPEYSESPWNLTTIKRALDALKGGMSETAARGWAMVSKDSWQLWKADPRRQTFASSVALCKAHGEASTVAKIIAFYDDPDKYQKIDARERALLLDYLSRVNDKYAPTQKQQIDDRNATMPMDPRKLRDEIKRLGTVKSNREGKFEMRAEGDAK